MVELRRAGHGSLVYKYSGGVGMKYTISSSKLQVQVDSQGGSLCSVKDMDGYEYLWQGDPKYWKGKAPNLFPYIGRLTEGKYLLDGKEYQMDRHGFVKSSELQLTEQGGEFIRLSMKDDPVTQKQYPFKFDFEICYRLEENRLHITYQVDNKDEKEMYFAVGGHPGFNLPMEQGLDFEDYALEFPSVSGIQKVVLSENYFTTDEREPFSLGDDGKLPLTHSLFDNDAIILDNVPKQVTLTSPKGKKGLKVSFPQMRYFAFWHTPGTDAPFLCFEPWSSLPSRQGIVEDLAKQEDLISLPPGERYTNNWVIEVL